MTKLLLDHRYLLSCYSHFMGIVISCLGLLLIAIDFTAFNRLSSLTLTLFSTGMLFYAASAVLYALKKPDINKISSLRKTIHMLIFSGSACHCMMLLIYFL